MQVTSLRTTDRLLSLSKISFQAKRRAADANQPRKHGSGPCSWTPPINSKRGVKYLNLYGGTGAGLAFPMQIG